MKRITLPNIITTVRLAGALGLIFTDALTTPFFIIITICGFSDLIDGTVARLTNSSSEFGARLDSVADLTFYSVMMVKLLPVIFVALPESLLIFSAVILAVRIVSYTAAAVKYRRFASLHTYMNKVTGAFVFFVPYFLPSEYALSYSVTVCIIAALASVEELLIHLLSDSYNPDVQSLAVWIMRKNENRK